MRVSKYYLLSVPQICNSTRVLRNVYSITSTNRNSHDEIIPNVILFYNIANKYGIDLTNKNNKVKYISNSTRTWIHNVRE